MMTTVDGCCLSSLKSDVVTMQRCVEAAVVDFFTRASGLAVPLFAAMNFSRRRKMDSMRTFRRSDHAEVGQVMMYPPTAAANGRTFWKRRRSIEVGVDAAASTA